MEGARYVGSYELFRIKDGAVNMTFSREVNDGLRLILGQDLRHPPRIVDITSDKDMPPVILETN